MCHRSSKPLPRAGPARGAADDKGQLQGMRVELANECCRRLGLAPEYIRTEFATMIPGLAAKRWDMINTGIFWTEERSKLMYMIPYEQAAISFLSAKGNPLGFKTIDDLAGRKVSVELGGIEERRTREVAKMVADKGLKPVTVCSDLLKAGGYGRAIRYLTAHDPPYFELLQLFLRESDPHRKFAAYEQIAAATLAPIGTLWEGEPTVLWNDDLPAS